MCTALTISFALCFVVAMGKGNCKVRLPAFWGSSVIFMAEPGLALLSPDQIQDLHSGVGDTEEKRVLPGFGS